MRFHAPGLSPAVTRSRGSVLTYETTTKRVRVTAAPVLEGVPGGQGRRCRAGPVSFPQGAAGPREGRLPRRELHAGRDTNSLVGVTLALERENKGVTRLQEV